LAASFYFYFRTVLLQRQVTQLTRHLALREPRRGSAASSIQAGLEGEGPAA
jgi:hypothetical protein